VRCLNRQALASGPPPAVSLFLQAGHRQFPQ